MSKPLERAKIEIDKFWAAIRQLPDFDKLLNHSDAHDGDVVIRTWAVSNACSRNGIDFPTPFALKRYVCARAMNPTFFCYEYRYSILQERMMGLWVFKRPAQEIIDLQPHKEGDPIA